MAQISGRCGNLHEKARRPATTVARMINCEAESWQCGCRPAVMLSVVSLKPASSFCSIILFRSVMGSSTILLFLYDCRRSSGGVRMRASLPGSEKSRCGRCGCPNRGSKMICFSYPLSTQKRACKIQSVKKPLAEWVEGETCSAIIKNITLGCYMT